MATFAELKAAGDNKKLVHRHLEGTALMAPMDVPLPDSLMESGTQLKAIPQGWWRVGLVSTDGWVFSEDTEKDEIEAWGYADPVRTDIIKAPKSVQVTLLEKHKRKALELIYSIDLSGVSPTAVGEIVFEEGATPAPVENRLLVISKDGTVAEPFIRGKGLASVKLAEKGEDAWSADADSAGQELTLDILAGPEGFAVRHYFGGAGFDADAHGFGSGLAG